MKKVSFFSLTTLSLLCTSCASDMPETVNVDQDLSSKSNLEYALDYVEELLGEIDPLTRGSKRTVADIQYVCSDATRSGEQDTTLYLVNYADNMGFALLDAEAKNGGIYAISPKGHLEFSDSVDNPLLAHFFRQVKRVSSNTPDTRALTDTLIGWDKPFKYVVTDHGGPKLCERYASWTCDLVRGAGPNDGYAPVTTAALCLAKMLAYYYHPSVINGKKINWDYISGQTYKMTAVHNLLAALNSKDVFYNPTSTATGTDDASLQFTPNQLLLAMDHIMDTPPTFYEAANSNVFSTYSQIRQVKNIIGTTVTLPSSHVPFGPVVAFAYPKDETTGTVLSYYQYWIIDGYIDRCKLAPYASWVPGQGTNMPTLYHCIWGLDDYLNGYYLFNSGEIGNDCVTSEGLTQPADPNIPTQKQDSQYLFPNPGAMGGIDLQPLPMPN